MSSTNEPSFAKNGDSVLYVGNWYAALSDDAGQTWQFIDPSDYFPQDGVPDDVTGTSGLFCCDQVAIDVPSHDMVAWYLQYVCDAAAAEGNGCVSGNENAQRLAISRGSAELANGVFDCNYLLYPSQIGRSGFWYDFPTLSVTDSYLFVTTNVFPSEPDFEEAYAVVMRFLLSDLADCPDIIDYEYFENGGLGSWNGFTPVSGADDAMYFGTNWGPIGGASNSAFSIYTWPDNGSMSQTIRTVDSWPTNFGGEAHCVGPDGNDSCGRIDQRVMTGWVASGTVGFMFMVKEGAIGRPYPYTRVLTFEEVDLSYAGWFDIFWESNAYIYPSVAVNGSGDIGATITIAGGDWNPSTGFWIWDDDTPFGPGFTVNLGRVGTNGPSSGRWGDYLTVHADASTDTWFASGFTLQGSDCPGGGGEHCSAVEPRLYWFGRERDRPATVATSTPTLASAATSTPIPTSTSAPLPTDTPMPQATATPTLTDTPTHTPTDTPTNTPTHTPTNTPTPVLVGDTNCDGTVNPLDAALILQLSAGMIPALPCPGGGDVDGDGTTNPLDAALVLQFSAGLITSLPT